MGMKSTAMRGAAVAAVCLLGLALGLTLGCRKSKAKDEQEQKEQKVELKHKSDTGEAKQRASDREYQQIKDMVKRGNYQEAWDKLDTLAATDEQIKWQSDIYKKGAFTDELLKQADALSDIQQEQYQQAYERLMWVQTHIESRREEAAKKAAVVAHRAQACDLYKRALAKIQGYRGGEAVTLLERVRDQYGDTDYAPLAQQRLREIQGPPPHSTDPD
jgi:outer membrane protein assembly factor BamD (BamD/ComL family)